MRDVMLRTRSATARGLLTIFAALVLMIGVSTATCAQVDDSASADAGRRTTLRFLTDSDFPPFNYFEEDNTLTGFNVDVARAICVELAVACDVRVRPWGELLPALRRGEADAVIASHKLSAAALKGVAFTDRYYHTPARFAARRSFARIEATPEGLEGQRIAVAKGTAHEAYVRAFFRDSTVRVFETVELARDALVTGAADVLFDDAISLAFWLNGTASKACCEFRGGPYAEPKFFGDGVGIALRQGDAELKTQINTALRKLRENGRYEEMVLRYFPLRAF